MQCKWPGRAQTIRTNMGDNIDNLTLYLDGAHTTGSIEACMKWFCKVLNELNGHSSKKEDYNVLVFNCKTDRNPKELLSVIVKQNMHKEFRKVIFCNMVMTDAGKQNTSWQESNNAIWKELCHQEGVVFGNIPNGLDYLTKLCKENNDKEVRVLVTGSLYLVGGFLEVLINRGVLTEQILDM